jgi:hypothetical protein
MRALPAEPGRAGAPEKPGISGIEEIVALDQSHSMAFAARRREQDANARPERSGYIAD